MAKNSNKSKSKTSNSGGKSYKDDKPPKASSSSKKSNSKPPSSGKSGGSKSSASPQRQSARQYDDAIRQMGQGGPQSTSQYNHDIYMMGRGMGPGHSSQVGHQMAQMFNQGGGMLQPPPPPPAPYSPPYHSNGYASYPNYPMYSPQPYHQPPPPPPQPQPYPQLPNSPAIGHLQPPGGIPPGMMPRRPAPPAPPRQQEQNYGPGLGRYPVQPPRPNPQQDQIFFNAPPPPPPPQVQYRQAPKTDLSKPLNMSPGGVNRDSGGDKAKKTKKMAARKNSGVDW